MQHKAHIAGAIIIVLVTILWFTPWIFKQSDFRTEDTHVLTVLTEHGLVAPWENKEFPYFMGFRPLPMSVLLLQSRVFHTNAMGYYAVGLFLHLSAILFFYLLLLTVMSHFASRIPVLVSVITTLTLSLHADAFYNVLWISNQTETLSLLFSVVYLWLMLKYLSAEKSIYSIVATVLLLAGFFVKISIIVLPFLFAFIALIYYKSEKTALRPRPLILTSAVGIVLSSSFVCFWLYFDRFRDVLSMDLLLTKPFSIAAIMMIAVHPFLSLELYPLLYERRLLAVIFALLFIALLFLSITKLKIYNRKILYSAIVLFIISVLPRAAYQIAPRINTLQICVFLLLAAVIVVLLRPRRAVGVMSILFVTHIIASLIQIPAWEEETDNGRYRLILEHSKQTASEKSILLVHTGQYHQYVMHFLRYGRFGKDTLLQSTPILLQRKYGSRRVKEYEMHKENRALQFEVNDRRIAFDYDSLMTMPSWLEASFTEPFRDYGYRRLRLSADKVPAGTDLWIERNLVFEKVALY